MTLSHAIRPRRRKEYLERSASYEMSGKAGALRSNRQDFVLILRRSHNIIPRRIGTKMELCRDIILRSDAECTLEGP